MSATRMSATGGRRGFTLVELLVVIGIIALLISILLPSLSRVQQSARAVKCQANLRSIGQAMAIYTAQSKGTLPYGWWNGSPPNYSGATDGSKASHWVLLLLATMDGKYGSTFNDAFASNANTAKLRESMFCPDVDSIATDVADSAATHYVSHPRLMPQLGMVDGWAVANGAPAGTPVRPYKISKIKRSSEIALIFDGSLVNVGGVWRPRYGVPVANALDSYRMYYSTFMTDDYTLDGSSFMNPGNPVDLSPSSGNVAFFNRDAEENTHNIRFRHRKDTTANVLFVDGHVSEFSAKDRYNTTLTRGNINVNP